MTTPRVVITGVGVVSPLGSSLPELTTALRDGRSAVRPMPQWAEIGQLGCRVAAPVEGLELARRWPRKKSRTLGRVAGLAVVATEAAVADAGLTEADLQGDDVGLAYGSTHGSSTEQEQFCRDLFATNSLAKIASSTYLKFMSHTCAANLALFFGIRGRVLSTSAACVSASQAIGAGFESIRSGATSVMVCGGSEEMHFMHAGVFDVLYAASTKYNDRPELTPRPFDRDRDGLVVAEGAGTVVLETLEHAQARGARIHAELLGYGTTCDGTHLTNPSVDGMARALELALKVARLGPKDIDYVNAHATATQAGDICESAATLRALGSETPISSTKGQTGHTLGACGSIELALCLAMMKEGFIAPTRNLEHVDPECRELDYVMGEPRAASLDTVMSNNFAFGGINTSLVMRRM
ncbi:beta-ketoacyl-ACP synthase [Paraliomyxa miuraensis]|uniref:beta-ketoacyl-ACP synthase n=1 Tax=Paraliomyxa miuraensis TaxID=376150 RepID=UPI00225945DF|nr:beta-ketoacyl-ACP synthase [Paraliomyxa miuraensis]MCX4247040.1 beta-ketoacyl-ACP synthase [Paraliomyxa miuraensis]